MLYYDRGNFGLQYFPYMLPTSVRWEAYFFNGGDLMLRKKMSVSKDIGIFRKTAKSSKVINYVTVKRGGIRL